MWFLVAVFVVALVLAVAMIPKPQASKPQGLEDVTAPTADEGREVAVLFGTRVIEGPNLVWYGDFKALPIFK